MSGFCKCGDGGQNLGVLACPRLLQSVKKHVRVATFDESGVRNSIKLTDLVDGKLTDAYVLGKLSSTGGDKWYLTPKTYENVEPSRTDSSFEDFSSGAKVKIDTGVKEFMGIIPMIDAQIAAKMNAGSCSTFGVYEVDSAGSIKGELSADGLELFPITVAQGSFEAVEIEAVEGSAVQRVSISFQYAKTVNEGQLRIINTEDILVNLLSINGILDGELVLEGAATATSFSATLAIADFGYFGESIPIEGQVEPADWLIVDSSLTVITPTAVSEIIAGQYDFDIPSTPAESLSVTFIGAPEKAADQMYASNTLVVVTP